METKTRSLMLIVACITIFIIGYIFSQQNWLMEDAAPLTKRNASQHASAPEMFATQSILMPSCGIWGESERFISFENFPRDEGGWGHFFSFFSLGEAIEASPADITFYANLRCADGSLSGSYAFDNDSYDFSEDIPLYISGCGDMGTLYVEPYFIIDGTSTDVILRHEGDNGEWYRTIGYSNTQGLGIGFHFNCGFCGNGNVDSGETCDDGNGYNFDTCRNDCSLPYCGDGICDEAMNENTAGQSCCHQDCTCYTAPPEVEKYKTKKQMPIKSLKEVPFGG